MLYRAWAVDQAEHLCTVLRQFNANNPSSKVPELMSVFLHRGHFFGGLEWSDRFLPQLMQVAAGIRGSNKEAFVSAVKLTYEYFRSCTQYGYTFTLREALAKKRLDCVRATDMIGAIYRNSGRPFFGNIWWSAGTSGHSVAAIGAIEDNATQFYVMDGMTDNQTPQKWPDLYFKGAVWPPTLAQNSPPHAAELYLRAIDGYIWAQGYVIRGEDAGTLVRAEIPYLPGQHTSSTARVYEPNDVAPGELTALAQRAQEAGQDSKNRPAAHVEDLVREMGDLSPDQVKILAEQIRKLKNPGG
jgi:hypothetical protein